MEEKIYLVTFADWDEFQVVEAFAKEADAEALAEKLNRGRGPGGYDVDELSLHAGPVDFVSYAEAEFWTNQPRRIDWLTSPKETVLSSEAEGLQVRIDDFSADSNRDPKGWEKVYRITVCGPGRDEVRDAGRTELDRLRKEIGSWSWRVECKKGCGWEGIRRGTCTSEVFRYQRCRDCGSLLEVKDRLERVG